MTASFGRSGDCPDCGRALPLFEMKDGSLRPIVHPRVRNDAIWLNMAPRVWCGGACGWVFISDTRYEELGAQPLVSGTVIR